MPNIKKRFFIQRIWFILLFVFSNLLFAQPLLHKIELPKKATRGDIIRVVLHGEELNKVVRIDSLHMSGQKIQVHDILSKSEEQIVFRIRIPKSLDDGKHLLSVLVSDEEHQYWLKPEFNLHYSNKPVNNKDSLLIHLTQSESGFTESEAFTILNSGSGPLTIDKVQMPLNFRSSLNLVGIFQPDDYLHFRLISSNISKSEPSGRMIFFFREIAEPYILDFKTDKPQPSIQFTLSSENKILFPAMDQPVESFYTPVDQPARKTFVLTNTGKETIELASVLTPKPFTHKNTVPIILQPQESKQLEFQLNPESPGIFSKITVFHFSKPFEHKFKLKLDATIETPSLPAIQIMDGLTQVFPGKNRRLVFDSVSVGNTSEKYLKITNTGQIETAIHNIDISDHFRTDDSFTEILPAGASFYLPISFAAATVGEFSGRMRISLFQQQDFEIDLALDGNVIKILEPPMPDIEIVIATDSPLITQTFTLQNTRNSVQLLNNLILPPGTQIIKPLPSQIPPGGIDSFSVQIEDSLILSEELPLQFDIAGRNDNPQLVSFSQSSFVLPKDENNITAQLLLGIVIALLLGGSVFLCWKFYPKFKVSKSVNDAGKTSNIRFYIKTEYDSGRQEILSSLFPDKNFNMYIKTVHDSGSQHFVSDIPPTDNAENFAKDDLSRIEGIGPKISQLLNNAEIFTYAQLSETRVDLLRNILNQASIWMIDPATWPEQAQLARDNNWKQLAALQEELIAGRRTNIET